MAHTQEILARVSNRFVTAVKFHKESSELFTFIGLEGYAKLHLFQFLDESYSSYKVKEFIIQHCNYIFEDAEPIEVNIIGPLTTGLDRFDIQQSQMQEIVKSSFMAYKKWETDTLEEYEQCASELLQQNDIPAYKLLQDIIEDVNEEIQEIKEMILDLQFVDYDPVHISETQEDIERDILQKSLESVSKLKHRE